VTVAGNGSYGSGNFTTAAAGTYRWTSTYTGDANNAASTSVCNAANESVVVTQAITSLTTTASATVGVGGSVSDSAVLAGGLSPTGSIAFSLFGPNDATCASAAIFTSAPVTVAGNGSYGSGNFTTAAAGTYRWTSTYTGDTNNTAAISACNAANESVVVSKTTPVFGAQASGLMVVGGAINDVATLSGALSPTGTITFSLYGTSTCTGTPLLTSTVTVSGNGTYTSASYTATAAGTLLFVASYSGDANNAASATACGSASQAAVILSGLPNAGGSHASVRTFPVWPAILVSVLLLIAVVGIGVVLGRRRAH